MDVKKATTLASVTVMTFMLAGGFFVQVTCFSFVMNFSEVLVHIIEVKPRSTIGSGDGDGKYKLFTSKETKLSQDRKDSR